MITVEKAIKSNKVKNATETGVSAKNNTKKYLLWGSVLLVGAYFGFKLLKGNKSEPSKIYTSNQ